MTRHDPRVDTYIAKAPPFAQPILEQLRAVVHAACPEASEDIKWSMPFFVYKDQPLCFMAAFKQHCGFGFWHAGKVIAGHADDGQTEKGQTDKGQTDKGMGQFGKLTSVKDLPGKRELSTHIKKAMALSDAGVKLARPKAAPKPAPTLPHDLAALLAQKKHAAARKSYEGFSPGAQREYVEWITEAKTDATREKRLATTLEWLAEGKRRNWKYEKC